MTTATRQGYINLKELAEYLNIGYSTARRDWPWWKQKGIRIFNYPGKEYQVRASDADKIMALYEV
jgi:hypothetical protein